MTTREVLATLHAHTVQLAAEEPEHVTVAGLLGEPEDTPAGELLTIWAELLYAAVEALDTATKAASAAPRAQSYTTLGAQPGRTSAAGVYGSAGARRYDRRGLPGGSS